MKQPRTADFDPSPKRHGLKSSLENMPVIEKQSQPVREGNDTSPVRPVRGVLPSPVVRRKIKSRHPFDIYEDQVEQLKQLSLEDKMRGGTGSMSAMVREAIDAYIALKQAG